jgi:hypothetical protein
LTLLPSKCRRLLWKAPNRLIVSLRRAVGMQFHGNILEDNYYTNRLNQRICRRNKLYKRECLGITWTYRLDGLNEIKLAFSPEPATIREDPATN